MPARPIWKSLEAAKRISDNKLNMDKWSFYPNPLNGKFNLRFNLKNKGNTSVNVMNTEGKTIYTETLQQLQRNLRWRG